ncbi:MAG: signal peptidase I [Clostridia bacterium]|nr:signal peptidase I [Clostridia bacterium]
MQVPKRQYVRKTPESASEIYFWAKTLSVALIALILVNTFFLRLSTVSGSSMFPTLNNMDQLLLQVAGYNTRRNPAERGDIVVVISEEYGSDIPLVKRIIGVAGDVIDITEDGRVSVNGTVLQEDYISEPIRSGERGSVSYPYTVSAGCVFVMGDNRNLSQDSRDLGEIPCDGIVGKAVVRIWPLNKFGGVE